MVVGTLSEATEIAVIGGGVGGYVAAIRLAQYGKEVTLINREALPGGVCLLRGCIPSKALIEAANFYRRIPAAAHFGVLAEKVSVDFSKMQQWKNSIVDKLGHNVAGLLKQNGVQYLQGEAVFSAAHTLEIRGESGLGELNFKSAIIASGGRPRALGGIEFDGERILSSDHALSLQEIPERLLVVGGGYIGLELGEVYAKLGSQVTIVEALPSLLSGIDPALLRPLNRKLETLSVEVLLETQVASAKNQGKEVAVILKDKSGSSIERTCSHLLIAVGRRPNSENLGLQKLGVETDAKGYLRVNSRMQSSRPHLYAVGDVAGGIQLAHKASREGLVAAANIAGHADAFDNQVPAVIFTDPEIAYVGMDELQAKAQGLKVLTGQFPFAANGRALTMDETEGFVKVVVEASSKRILGIQMVGPHVSDLISEATVALEMGAFLEDLELTIHPHPTLSETLHEAVESVLGMSIHR
ncbi:MAG TPA: dihydrolipoyl dehydrogenase, partial [Deltaproteobacteria bacterium]|nr:dihydrolipoyl dehydrogenase [Deltaproteobacteria bacterium]